METTINETIRKTRNEKTTECQFTITQNIDNKIIDVLKERKWNIGDLIEIFLDSITPEKAEEIAFAVDAGIEKVEIILDTSIKEE